MNDYEIAYGDLGYQVYDYYGTIVFSALTLEECEAWCERQEPTDYDLPEDNTEF